MGDRTAPLAKQGKNAVSQTTDDELCIQKGSDSCTVSPTYNYRHFRNSQQIAPPAPFFFLLATDCRNLMLEQQKLKESGGRKVMVNQQKVQASARLDFCQASKSWIMYSARAVKWVNAHHDLLLIMLETAKHFMEVNAFLLTRIHHLMLIQKTNISKTFDLGTCSVTSQKLISIILYKSLT